MRITETQLLTQYRRAETEWPWIATVERTASLPPMLLWALGSRETNLRNVIGDGGYGIGIWQRDKRSWTITGGVRWYLNHPRQQADEAAALLVGLRDQLPDWHAAIAAYNAGLGAVRGALARQVDPDRVTTHGDYAADVEERRIALLIATGHPARPAVRPPSAVPVAAPPPAQPAPAGGIKTAPVAPVPAAAKPTTQRSTTVPAAAMLSQHFAVAEFACRHCGRLPKGGVSKALLAKLELLRMTHFPGGLDIKSGYRCPQHRLSQARPGSRHVKGDAADIPPLITVAQAKRLGFHGIGYNSRGLVVHVDMRPILPGRPVVFPDAGTA